MLGLGDGIVLYLREDEVERDPDSEDLSSFNNMFKSKKKNELKALEESEKKGISAAAGAASSTRPQNKPKDKERDCSIF